MPSGRALLLGTGAIRIFHVYARSLAVGRHSGVIVLCITGRLMLTELHVVASLQRRNLVVLREMAWPT